jgi:2,4-diaminopentanoate dehydrogenase
MRKYRVIIWGLGNVGRIAVRMCMEKESLELVGAIDVAPDKVGRDAGEIFGFGKAGVIVSNDVEKEFAKEADVIMCYLPNLMKKGSRKPSADNIVRALKAKKNVITTIPISYPAQSEPELVKMLDEAAKENGVTFLQLGLMPGLYSNYFPVALSAAMERVDRVIMECGEDDQGNTSDWVRFFGYGKKLEEINVEAIRRGIENYYGDGVWEVGERLGFPLTEVRCTDDAFTTSIPLKTVGGDIPAGTVCGHRFIWHGMVGDKELVTLVYIHNVCNDKIDAPKIIERIRFEGSPLVVDVEIKGLMPPFDQSFETSVAPTIHVIPRVVAAEPGYKFALDLPVIIPIR